MSADVLLCIRGVGGGLLLLASLGFGSTLLALRLAPDARPSVKWCAALVLAFLIPSAAFHLLTALSLFRLDVALLVAAAGLAQSLYAYRRFEALRTALRRLFSETRSALTPPSRMLSVLAALTLALILLRLLRGLVAPPMAWDVLTYHLVKVARWIRTGGLSPTVAPDAWDGYEYFPYGGDALWAWALLPFHSDAPLGLASALVFGAVVLGAYALIRELGGTRENAWLGALALCLVPSAFNFLASGYVENASLAVFLLGVLFLCRYMGRQAAWADGLLAVGAFAVGAGIKASGIPTYFLSVAAVAGGLLWRDAFKGVRTRSLAAALLSLAVAAPPYLRAYLDRGSPAYPLPLRIGSWLSLPGHPRTVLALEGKLYRGMGHFTWDNFLVDLTSRRPDRDFLNLWWGTFPLLLVGVWGILRSFRYGSSRRQALILLILGLVAVAGLFSPGSVGLRAHWGWIAGRFLLPAVAVLAVLGAAAEGLAVTWGLRVAVALGWYSAWPRGFSFEDASAMARLGGVLLVASALFAALAVTGRNRVRPAGMAAAGIATVALVGGAWGWVRHEARYPIWRAASECRAYDLHPFLRDYGSAVALWERVDGVAPRRIAVSAGWNFLGDNWLIYPFFGSRLQNEVNWIPPTADGAVIDYRLARANLARFDVGAWVTRLLDRDIDAVALLWPRTVERNWVQALPQLFEPIVVSADGKNGLYRLRRAAARTWLETGGRLPPIVIDVPPERPS
ncbi:MAG: hypothetical protein ACM3JH_05220 [Acidithiobacillales bacterium]